MKKINMKSWATELRAAEIKKPMPILSFPSIQLMNIGVKELISSSDRQAEGMRLVAESTNSAASVSMMDLSVEAEAFGSEIRFSDDEVPTVTGRIVTSLDDANALKVPPVMEGRRKIYVEAIEKAVKTINDRPVLCGVIGPFSLAGRLMDVSEAMINCYEEPEMVHLTLDKATEFIINYIKEYKAVGANGVVIAEPLAGILSPSLVGEFSSDYVRRIVSAVQEDDFIVIVHNCGNNTVQLIDSILSIGAGAYHFGNAIDMAEMIKHIPEDVIAMGNVDPAGQFRNGTPESIREITLELMQKCAGYDNFVPSSGCDIPPLSKWENISAFFAAIDEFYGKSGMQSA